MKNNAQDEIFLVSCVLDGKADIHSREMTLRAAEAYFHAVGGSMPPLSYSETGKPYWEGGEHHLSVTHSGSFFAAVFASFPIGVDAEEKGENRERIAARYFSQEERKMPFSFVWTAKEAVSKISGKGIGLLSQITVCNERFARIQEEIFCLASLERDGYQLTVAWPQEEGGAVPWKKNAFRKTIRDLSVSTAEN